MDEILKEFLTIEGKKKIDGDVLKDVHLVGFKSSNKAKGQTEPYTYAAEALKAAVAAGLYNDVVIGMDHQKDENAVNNKASNRIGVTSNARFVESKGVVGDIKLNPLHPMSKSIVWWAENYPNKMGLSHVAKVRFSESTNSVVEISKVDIIDFVGNSSTTAGIFAESTNITPVELGEGNEKLYTVIEAAVSSIHSNLYPLEKDLTPQDKLINIVQIAESLATDLKKHTNNPPKERTMEWTDITLETLKANKPDLVSTIVTEAVNAEKQILAKVKEATSALPESARTDVFIKLIESQVRAGNDVTELVNDRKSVVTVVESRTSDAPPKTEDKPKVISDDDILSAIKSN